jgi:hypothetical protein
MSEKAGRLRELVTVFKIDAGEKPRAVADERRAQRTPVAVKAVPVPRASARLARVRSLPAARVANGRGVIEEF